MASRRILISGLLTLSMPFVACSCADQTRDLDALAELGCLEHAPDGLGLPCAGLGECQVGLNCTEGTCELPPTILPSDAMPEIRIGPSTFRAELARTELELARGLGERSCMSAGTAMLFEFPFEQSVSFTTEAMRYDIDIAFVDDARRVREVMRSVPAGAIALWQPRDEVQWVLETPANALAEVSEGDELSLP